MSSVCQTIAVPSGQIHVVTIGVDASECTWTGPFSATVTDIFLGIELGKISHGSSIRLEQGDYEICWPEVCDLQVDLIIKELNDSSSSIFNTVTLPDICVNVDGSPASVIPLVNIDTSSNSISSVLYVDHMGNDITGVVTPADQCDCDCLECIEDPLLETHQRFIICNTDLSTNYFIGGSFPTVQPIWRDEIGVETTGTSFSKTYPDNTERCVTLYFPRDVQAGLLGGPLFVFSNNEMTSITVSDPILAPNAQFLNGTHLITQFNFSMFPTSTNFFLANGLLTSVDLSNNPITGNYILNNNQIDSVVLPIGGVIGDLRLQNNLLDTADVDQILIDMDTMTPAFFGTITLSMQSPPAPPSAASAAAIASLVGKGYNVITD